MLKILVTGGAGFIGSHVVKKLIEIGHEVVIVDNFNPYYSPKLKQARIEVFLDGLKFKLHKIDIADFKALEEVFKVEKFDRICHLAAQAGVRYSLENPFVYEQSNVKGFLNILEACRQHNLPPLVYASTSSVYGSNTKLPFTETDRVDAPISLYAATKRANELMASTYHHLFGLKTCGLRFFTVYGPWGRPDMALFLFTKAIRTGQPIKVFNGGDMKRDFTFISDIVDGVVAALGANFDCDIFNLARGETQGLIGYIQALEKSLGQKAVMRMMPMQPGDVPATSADISKARKYLAYNPKVSIEAGVEEFVNWYQKYREQLALEQSQD